MPLYNLRSLTPTTFMIAKFSDDFEVESTYTLTAQGFSYLCDCPANNRTVITRPCRHKLMMPALLPYANTEKFYDFDTKMFCSPLGDLLRPEANPAGREALPDAGEALRAEGAVTGRFTTDGSHIGEVVGEAPGLSIPAERSELSKALMPVMPPVVPFTKQEIAANIVASASATTIRRR